MREAQRQVKLLAFDRGAHTDTVDFKVLGEAFGDSLDHVADKAAGGAV